MQRTFYLIRHAQCIVRPALGFPGWPLSPVGMKQAERLADLLGSLGITSVFSSPFARAIATARPFAQKHSLDILVVDGLRERMIVSDGRHPSDEVWCRSWEDFTFAPPGCEQSIDAQSRICKAIGDIALKALGASAVFTHGNILGLFLNSLESSFGRAEAEALTNPDVLRIEWQDGCFNWDRKFSLPGLEGIVTQHGQTPREEDLAAAKKPLVSEQGEAGNCED
jgi:2,3-bisphosphoglycerate-dependent phosphoglycerate mutase